MLVPFNASIEHQSSRESEKMAVIGNIVFYPIRIAPDKAI
jgi:hypothetical protein